MLRCAPKSLIVAIVSVVLLMSASLPQAQADLHSETRYFRGDDLPINYGSYQNVLGFLTYQASDGTPGVNFTMTTTGGNKKLQVGIRVWMDDGSMIPNITEITGGTPQAVITRDVGDTGISALSAQWTCSRFDFNGNQSFRVGVYKRYLIVGSTWSAWTSWLLPYLDFFHGLGLGYQTLASATWNVTYTTQRIYTGSATALFFLVGNSTWNSHIEGITYDNNINFSVDFSTGIFLGAFGGGIIAVIIAFAINKRH